MHLFFRCMMRSFWDESRCLCLTVTQEAVRPQPYQNKTTAVYRHSLFERQLTSEGRSDPGHWLVRSSTADVSVDQWNISGLRAARLLWLFLTCSSGYTWTQTRLHMFKQSHRDWFSHIRLCVRLLSQEVRVSSLEAWVYLSILQSEMSKRLWNDVASKNWKAPLIRAINIQWEHFLNESLTIQSTVR